MFKIKFILVFFITLTCIFQAQAYDNNKKIYQSNIESISITNTIIENTSNSKNLLYSNSVSGNLEKNEFKKNIELKYNGENIKLTKNDIILGTHQKYFLKNNIKKEYFSNTYIFNKKTQEISYYITISYLGKKYSLKGKTNLVDSIELKKQINNNTSIESKIDFNYQP